MSVSAFAGNVGFNAHHSPMGAFFSFTCGHFGTRGGMAAQSGRPGTQDLFIGVKDGDRHSNSILRCLPFYDGTDQLMQLAGSEPEVAQQSASAAAAFLVEQAVPGEKKPKVLPYQREQIERHYGWATDRWTTPDLRFTLFTPFGPIHDPAAASAARMRDCLLPAVTATLVVNNSRGKETKTGFFALGFTEPGARPIDEGLQDGRTRIGFAFRRHMGVAAELWEVGHVAEPAQKPFLFMRWNPAEALADASNPVHMLGSCPGIGFEVPPGKCYVLVIAIGCYLEGTVTTGLEGRYLYTRYFAGLPDVLDDALNRADELAARAERCDHELLESKLSPNQQFLLAHATRSYYGSTQLLDIGGQPYWIVNEGEYCMLNTLDLSVDHVFWELKHNPWVVRNLLDNFVRHYSYTDQCGLSFTHDQGVHNNFSPPGRSSYELAGLDGCFSHMTQEQLCNWSLIAATYVIRTKDTAWLTQNRHVIEACLKSMQNRDDPDPAQRNGVMSVDSSRCGRGQEITTYDSLDHSLAQSRNNLYVGVKCWATYLGLAMLLDELGDAAAAKTARDSASLSARTIMAQAGPDGILPAVFGKASPGYHSRILPAVEGLVYPLAWGKEAPEAFVSVLRRHTQALLSDPQRQNHFPDGGTKLSSTSNNSWFSKIALFQHVARKLLQLNEHGQPAPSSSVATGFAAADAAHVKWETEGASAYWAMSDQLVNGLAIGSKYYPRCVTAVLWLEE